MHSAEGKEFYTEPEAVRKVEKTNYFEYCKCIIQPDRSEKKMQKQYNKPLCHFNKTK